MEREHLQSAAVSYTYFKGLYAIPGGLLAIVAALGNWGWGPLQPQLGVPRRRRAARRGVPADRPLLRRELRPRDALDARPGAGRRGRRRRRAARLRHVAAAPQPRRLVARPAGQPDRRLARRADAGELRRRRGAAPPPRDRLRRPAGGGPLPVWNGADPSNIGLLLAGVAFIAAGILDHRAARPHLRPRQPPAARARECRSLTASWSSTGSSTSRAGWRS